MKFRTSTGSIIEPKLEEVTQQLLEAGYEVIEETSSEVIEGPVKKSSKTSKN